LDGETRAMHYNQWRLRWVNNHFVLKVFTDNFRMVKYSWIGETPFRNASMLTAICRSRISWPCSSWWLRHRLTKGHPPWKTLCPLNELLLVHATWSRVPSVIWIRNITGEKLKVSRTEGLLTRNSSRRESGADGVYQQHCLLVVPLLRVLTRTVASSEWAIRGNP
jgi:hypothetical protein